MPATNLLAVAEPHCFWPNLTWSDFAQMPDKDHVVIIAPVVGFADWGLGHPLDAEETVLLEVLRRAMTGESVHRYLVLPPWRYVLGPREGCMFSVSPEVAIAGLEELLASVKAAGFSRVAFFNASPWNEELIDAVARDERIGQELQMFCVNLSALDLDFHPARSRSRRKVQTVLTALLGTLPESEIGGVEPEPSPWEREPLPPLGGEPLSLSAAQPEAEAVLTEAAAHLASLLKEVSGRAALPRGGKLLTRTYP